MTAGTVKPKVPSGLRTLFPRERLRPWRDQGIRSGLPQTIDSEVVEQRLIRHQDHVFRLRLGDQQSVKWIFVIDPHLSCDPSMMNRDRKFDKSLIGYDRFEVTGDKAALGNFPMRYLVATSIAEAALTVMLFASSAIAF